MASHRVISPSLVGLDSSTGFSSDADMIDASEKQLMKRVISPKQSFILECIEEVLVHYGINLDLMFLPLTEVVEEEDMPVEDAGELSNVTRLSSGPDVSKDGESLLEELKMDTKDNNNDKLNNK